MYSFAIWHAGRRSPANSAGLCKLPSAQTCTHIKASEAWQTVLDCANYSLHKHAHIYTVLDCASHACGYLYALMKKNKFQFSWHGRHKKRKLSNNTECVRTCCSKLLYASLAYCDALNKSGLDHLDEWHRTRSKNLMKQKSFTLISPTVCMCHIQMVLQGSYLHNFHLPKLFITDEISVILHIYEVI